VTVLRWWDTGVPSPLVTNPPLRCLPCYDFVKTAEHLRVRTTRDEHGPGIRVRRSLIAGSGKRRGGIGRRPCWVLPRSWPLKVLMPEGSGPAYSTSAAGHRVRPPDHGAKNHQQTSLGPATPGRQNRLARAVAYAQGKVSLIIRLRRATNAIVNPRVSGEFHRCSFSSALDRTSRTSDWFVRVRPVPPAATFYGSELRPRTSLDSRRTVVPSTGR